MLDDKGFDLWADEYDGDVLTSDMENSYPFAGYKKILSYIYQTVLTKKNPVVLDVGFGTGKLLTKLFEQGCDVYGQDFSGKMIEVVSQKVPASNLFQKDFSTGLDERLMQKSYDFIIATYSLHHLTDEQKVPLLRTMQTLLKPEGMILIGDVAFETCKELDDCRKTVGDGWDADEIYFVVEEMRRFFPNIIFQPFSFCSGVLKLGKETI